MLKNIIDMLLVELEMENKMIKVDNAIIMAAGTSSRFAPISYEMPKSLITVKGEVLIERQIKQLQEAGIKDITIVVGYKKEKFDYLKEKFGVKIIVNDDFLIRNNNSTIYAVKDILKNSYICSSDNYFAKNPFSAEVEDSYYAVVYADGKTSEWCVSTDKYGYISQVNIGGENRWYMMGHTFWSEEFSKNFLKILLNIYDEEKTFDLLWEAIYMQHLDILKMRIKEYSSEDIYEFDTLDELRLFDKSYIQNTQSVILKNIACKLNCKESEIVDIKAYKDKNNAAAGFKFILHGKNYKYDYSKRDIEIYK